MAVINKPFSRMSLAPKDLLKFVGTAVAGTNKSARTLDFFASSLIQNNPALKKLSAAGGFTVLGKNAFGQDVARDNTTGAIRTVDAFNPVSPEARALGESGTPKSIVAKGNIRRRNPRSGKGSTTGRRLNKVGSSSILGAQSILG